MPIIADLNATNSSLLISSGNYVDFNMWLLIFGVGLAMIIVSRIFAKDQTGGLLIGIMGFIFSVGATWTSLSVARIDNAVGAFVVNENITTQYVYPTIQPMNSTALTMLCIIVTVFAALNVIDLFLSILQRPPQEPKKPGRGVKISGKTVNI
jgi:hypothetical protein